MVFISKLVIHVVSDSLGETGELVIRAAISQFNMAEYEIRRYSHIQDRYTLEKILNKLVEEENSLLVYTLVDQKLLKYIKLYEKEKDIDTIDLMSPSISILSDKLGLDPKYESGAIRRLDEEYFRRIDAIEFAVKYDDGKDPRGFKEADLVIIGVSRTSKTPLSMYLANKNIKVANLPLVLDTKLPEEIFQIPSNRIIGLTNSPIKLNEIREERLKSLGLSKSADYANMEKILEELEYADRIMKKIGCPIIDVSNKAIEETSEIIIGLLDKNKTIIE